MNEKQKDTVKDEESSEFSLHCVLMMFMSWGFQFRRYRSAEIVFVHIQSSCPIWSCGEGSN